MTEKITIEEAIVTAIKSVKGADQMGVGKLKDYIVQKPQRY